VIALKDKRGGNTKRNLDTLGKGKLKRTKARGGGQNSLNKASGKEMLMEGGYRTGREGGKRRESL